MATSDFRLIAPPHTPFHNDGSLHLELVEKQAQLLVDTTVDGVFVAGSTGEGQSLTTEERLQLAERWMQVAQGTELEVMIQVGHNSQLDAIAMARHAQRIGADAISASSPNYFKPQSIGDLIDYLAPVAAAAGDLPFYFYEIPPMTNVVLPMVELLGRGKERIPNLVGLKYSNIELMQMQQCVQLNNGEFEVLFGCDQALMAGAALGARGAVGTTYNFAAPLYRRMLAALNSGNLEAARAEQAKSVELVTTCIPYGGIAAFKCLMSHFGIDCGPVRAPVRNLSAEEKHELIGKLESGGLLDFTTPVASCETA